MRTKIKKHKYTKHRDTKQNAIKQKGGQLLGHGKDGCVVDSIQYNSFSLENGYVAKVFKNHSRNIKLQELLQTIDPNELRYARYYYVPLIEKDSILSPNNQDLQKCKALIGDRIAGFNDVAFIKRLKPINPETLTRGQYRYLRESIKILHNNGITHNDLIGNVMIDPVDKNPRIIDWDNAQYDEAFNQSNASSLFKLNVEIDNNAFLTYFTPLHI